jgi:hypothetical protein
MEGEEWFINKDDLGDQMSQPLGLSDWQGVLGAIVGIILLASVCLCLWRVCVASLRAWRSCFQMYMFVLYVIRALNR